MRLRWRVDPVEAWRSCSRPSGVSGGPRKWRKARQSRRSTDSGVSCDWEVPPALAPSAVQVLLQVHARVDEPRAHLRRTGRAHARGCGSLVPARARRTKSTPTGARRPKKHGAPSRTSAAGPSCRACHLPKASPGAAARGADAAPGVLRPHAAPPRARMAVCVCVCVCALTEALRAEERRAAQEVDRRGPAQWDGPIRARNTRTHRRTLRHARTSTHARAIASKLRTQNTNACAREYHRNVARTCGGTTDDGTLIRC